VAPLRVDEFTLMGPRLRAAVRRHLAAGPPPLVPMTACGNRTKTAAYRARHKVKATGADE
jgi:hypothetical protein